MDVVARHVATDDPHVERPTHFPDEIPEPIANGTHHHRFSVFGNPHQVQMDQK
jgi:hypothetical protein